jgi:two-component system, OmpR family, alkaline phosphatase synthesis response regulator PhoP
MSKKRILLVDDETGITTMTKLNLEKTGLYEVQVENRSTRAFAAAKAFNPDLILLDMTMPDMDGVDVASQIKADAELKYTPIVFLTAMVSQFETGDNQLTRGGQVFLSKPVSQKTLRACIEQHARQRTDTVTSNTVPLD